MKLVSLLIGYLCGNILTAKFVAKIYGKDVREIDPNSKHKGNPGMANVMLNMGFLPGVMVLFGDILKVLVAYLITYLIYQDISLFVYTGFGAILGHDFPFIDKFNGGKGVLVTMVWFATIMNKQCLFIFGICGLIVLFTGYLNLAAIILPIIAIPFAYNILGINIGILVVVSAILMIIRNIEDIKKLFNGTLDRHYFIKFKKRL